MDDKSLEKCIVCDIVTDTPKNLDVNYRSNYIEGAGQLCKNCFDSIDNKKYIPIYDKSR